MHQAFNLNAKVMHKFGQIHSFMLAKGDAGVGKRWVRNGARGEGRRFIVTQNVCVCVCIDRL